MAIDGLLASLIYLDETKCSGTHVLNTGQRVMTSWQIMLDFRIEIEQYWNALNNITQTQDRPGYNILLISFPTPAHLYEAAVFTFRNLLLTGSKPVSLDNVFALCSLSYIASACSQKMGILNIDNNFCDINVWRDLVDNPQHRQLFSDLTERLWDGMPLSPFQIEQPLHSTSQPLAGPDCTSSLSTTIQDVSLLGGFSDPFWGDLMPDSLPGPNFQLTGTAEGSHPTILNTPDRQLSDRNLGESAVISILTNFLANCGELMDIFCGHGATAKGPHADVPVGVRAFVGSLRTYDCFKDPSSRGILAIVDRFVDLNYFQSIDEVREYMMIVGKVKLPNHL
ncbi:hypothetical protein FBEOM_11867 [Fusarium beomiforme]|uniref:Uncharacterized protein n=1 Tax=Fusarium beomiforme TaxID=44412 RepID=A0A9P5DTK9_9HYPO|nr:hypothetical protein FBEOM_11867 [Fusarium beomiforme]